jgi:putative nucleotidyltransferase with HDIG domain
MNLVETIIESAQQLPPFPAVIQRALTLINDPKSSVSAVVETIQYDQAITANVLRICNSPFYGLRQPVSSLQEAVMLIGFDPLLEIVLGSVAGSSLGESIPGYDLEAGELWKHSISSALLSQIISQRLQWAQDHMIFTAALIHDIGKVMLNTYVKDQLLTIKELVKTKKMSFLAAEKEVLGIDHAELSALISEHWNFPKEIVQAIRYHHTPLLAPTDKEVVYLIYLSNLVAMLTGIGGGADGLSYPGYDEVMYHFKLEEKDVEKFMAQLGEQIQKVEALIQLQKPEENS